jgi:trimethylamine:corrinoid methyltransferase-like protein
LAKARQKVNQLISEYRKPEVDPAKLEKMRAVVGKAKKARAASC